MHAATSAPDGDDEDWQAAPCGLLRLDHRGVVRSVNDRFLLRTGYRRSQIVGRARWTDLLTPGSRLFYETQLAPVLELDGALEEVMLDLLGADGRRLPGLLSATRICDGAGACSGTRIAVMTVPDRRRYEEELRSARRQAELANVANTQVRRRLELLAQANTALASSIDVQVALTHLAAVLATRLADWCLIYATDQSRPEDPPQLAAVHSDPARQPALERLAELLPSHSSQTSSLRQVLEGGAPVLLTEVTAAHQQESTDSAEVLALYGGLDLSSALVVPSPARGARVATMILIRGRDRPPFTEEDLADVTDLAARTGIVIDNLRRHAREHDDSIALQQALLTPPPPTAGLQIVTRYLPASTGAEIGGDWYDAFEQPDGTVVVVIGDVVGHDIKAAAAMGQLRGVIRTVGYALSATPADTLTRADEAARGLQVGVLASAVAARIQRGDGAVGSTMQWSNAGHPPPILLRADGSIRLLDSPPQLMLGVIVGRARRNDSVALDPGDTVVLYTDGLIERPTEHIDTGIGRLLSSLQGCHELSLDQLCDCILRRHAEDRRDDIAVLALRLDVAGSECAEAHRPQAR